MSFLFEPSGRGRTRMPAMPLLLAPASARGWFGGRSLEARDPEESLWDRGLVEASRALEATFSGERDGLTAALVSYEGSVRVVHYRSFAQGRPAVPAPVIAPDQPLLAGATFDFDGHTFGAAVREVHERIAAGDVYVLNLTGRLVGRPVLAPRATFDALFARGGGDMSAFVGGPGGNEGTIASVSPERFVRIRDHGGARTIEVWPIKGTRPRGADAGHDRTLADELAADPKERAEHVMVVDMERNDIGRVCAAGSVHVEPLMEIVQTPYCHQMVSGVRGVLSPGADLSLVLESVFPCGSVTGAPKHAAMRIIRELENGPRGAYCGVLMVAIRGEIDSSVLIRTLEWTSPDRAVWGSGCGITYESDPEAEWREVLLKASPVLGPPTA
ncbi:MAG: chorismate-binding protein [Coriobacteriia bacterium]